MIAWAESSQVEVFDGAPLSTITTVRGLARPTARISRSCSFGRSSVGLSASRAAPSVS